VNKVAANSEGFEQQAIAHKKAINLIQPKVLSCEAETAISELEQHNTFSTEIANVQLMYESVPRTKKVFKPSFKVKNVLSHLLQEKVLFIGYFFCQFCFRQQQFLAGKKNEAMKDVVVAF
jgi:hypothetical protein